jgi:hypothetical protein
MSSLNVQFYCTDIEIENLIIIPQEYHGDETPAHPIKLPLISPLNDPIILANLLMWHD